MVLKEIFKYMVTEARIICAAKWKSDVCPSMEEWENKVADCAVMAKLSTYLRSKSILKSEETWSASYVSRRQT